MRETFDVHPDAPLHFRADDDPEPTRLYLQASTLPGFLLRLPAFWMAFMVLAIRVRVWSRRLSGISSVASLGNHQENIAYAVATMTMTQFVGLWRSAQRLVAVVVAIVGVGAGIVVFAIGLHRYSTTLSFLGVFIYFGTMVMLYLTQWLGGRDWIRIALKRYVLTVVHMEGRARTFRTAASKVVIMRDLGHIARALERLPSTYRGGLDEATSDYLYPLAARKAAYVRGLKVWVVQPNPFTFTDLCDKLWESFALIAAKKWYELDEGPVSSALIGPAKEEAFRSLGPDRYPCRRFDHERPILETPWRGCVSNR